jgi:casein kinase 1 epsilon
MESISSTQPLLEMEGVIGIKYNLIKQIGRGSFGSVYLGQHKRSGEFVAIKCEDKSSKNRLLKHETMIYRDLKGPPTAGIINVRWFGVDTKQTYAVLDLLGESLDDHFNSNGKFSLKSTLIVGIQLVDRMEYIHNKGYIHRDIKPENFMFGKSGISKDVLHAIDFGLSRGYMVKNRHMDLKTGKKMIGTPRYASLNMHDGLEPSRRDDLISIGYMLIYLHNGNLPWEGQRGKTKQDKYEKISNIKRLILVKTLCERLPNEFVSFIEYCYDLRFEEKPNYELLRRLFKSVLTRNNLTNDYVYDWTTYSSINCAN